MSARKLALAASLLAAAAASARSAEGLVGADDPLALVAIIQDFRFKARLEEDDVGDPLLKSSAGGTDFAGLLQRAASQLYV